MLAAVEGFTLCPVEQIQEGVASDAGCVEKILGPANRDLAIGPITELFGEAVDRRGDGRVVVCFTPWSQASFAVEGNRSQAMVRSYSSQVRTWWDPVCVRLIHKKVIFRIVEICLVVSSFLSVLLSPLSCLSCC